MIPTKQYRYKQRDDPFVTWERKQRRSTSASKAEACDKVGRPHKQARPLSVSIRQYPVIINGHNVRFHVPTVLLVGGVQLHELTKRLKNERFRAKIAGKRPIFPCFRAKKEHVYFAEMVLACQARKGVELYETLLDMGAVTWHGLWPEQRC